MGRLIAPVTCSHAWSLGLLPPYRQDVYEHNAFWEVSGICALRVVMPRRQVGHPRYKRQDVSVA